MPIVQLNLSNTSYLPNNAANRRSELSLSSTFIAKSDVISAQLIVPDDRSQTLIISIPDWLSVLDACAWGAIKAKAMIAKNIAINVKTTFVYRSEVI